MSDPEPSVARVKSIKMRNFRGWVGDAAWSRGVGLDADIVLISAANGRGKSSLIEALARVLNGQGFHADQENQSLRKDEAWGVQLATNIRDISHDDEAWKQRLAGNDLYNRYTEVLQRATTFLQDRLDDQLEGPTGKSERTLLAFLAPVPLWLRDYAKALDERREEWSREPIEPPTVELEAARRQRDQAAAELGDAIVPMLAAPPPAAGAPMQRLAALAQAATGRAATADDPEAWLPDLKNRLRQGVRETEEERRLAAEAEAKLAEAQQALDAHEQDWPGLSDLAGWARGNPDLERVIELVAGLAERPGRWADADSAITALGKLPEHSRRQVPLSDEALRGLGAEFARVDRARAARYRDAISGWKMFWEERERERKDLESHRAEGRETLDQWERQRGAGRALRLLDDLTRAHSAFRSHEDSREKARRTRALWAKRRPLVEVLQRQLNSVRRLQEEELDDDVARQVKESMNAVMRHFIVAGLEGKEKLVEVEVVSGRVMEPRLPDDRTIGNQMSTGQRAQMALAWLLGSNALLQRWLPHRVLLLDDVSTALDLTNLAAECALLRKFAYTPTARQRQVIIASHHDQLTHRMFDLLLPPEGFSLREIRLVDWSIGNGPTREESNIKHTGKATDETRKRLADHLGTVFQDREKWRRAG